MQLNSDITKDISSYGGAIFSCDCKRTHTVLTADIVAGHGAFKSLIKVIGSIMPIGMGIALAYGSKHESAALEIDRILRRGGYKVLRVVLGDKVKNQAEEYDGIGAIIAAGGSEDINCGKLLAAQKNLPLCVCPLTCCTTNSLLKIVQTNKDNLYTFLSCAAPRACVCDYSFFDSGLEEVATAYGEITSKILALFDWRFCSLIDGSSYCENIAEQCTDIADTVLKALKAAKRGDKQCADILADNGLRLSALGQMTENSKLFTLSDSQTAQAMKMLFKAEDRHAKADGINSFIFSNILTKIYRQVLEADNLGLTFPPNNNLRIEKISEFFKVSPFAAAGLVSPIVGGETLRIREYKTNEYRTELRDMIVDIDVMLCEAYQCFKRLFADDGYWLINYLDNSDVSLCLALAPDIGGGYTFLTYLKDLGLLDKYL